MQFRTIRKVGMVDKQRIAWRIFGEAPMFDLRARVSTTRTLATSGSNRKVNNERVCGNTRSNSRETRVDGASITIRIDAILSNNARRVRK